MSGLAERLAQEAVRRCLLHADIGTPCEPCVSAAIRQALDEAETAARALDRGEWPIELEDAWRAAQARIAAAIEALK